MAQKNQNSRTGKKELTKSKMEVKIFWQEQCPACPAAKELGKKLEQEGVKVTYHNVKEVDGLTTATLFGVMSTPSVVVAEGDNEIASWKEEVPSLEEVKKHLER